MEGSRNDCVLNVIKITNQDVCYLKLKTDNTVMYNYLFLLTVHT